MTHVANLPEGAEVLGPIAKACPGEMYTDSQGMQAHSTPRAMTAVDIWDPRVVDGFAARRRVITFDNRGVGAGLGEPR